MNVCVLGLGYIGLPTAAIASSAGHKVVGVDINSYVVDTINLGKIHITEPGLKEIVSDCVKNGNFVAGTKVEPADVFIIAVPTPFQSELGSNIPKPNLSFVYKAVKEIISVLKSGDLIILESTSPIGTTRELSKYIEKELQNYHGTEYKLDYHIAYCPERVIPGNALHELKSNARVIGGLTKKCSQKAVEFYASFVDADCSIANGPEVAEMTKISENSYRDLNIAFANQLSRIADDHHIDIWEVLHQTNKHPRVNILSPGPGVGGHCIAVDPWFLINSALNHTRLSETARHVNDEQPNYVFSKVCSLAERHPEKNILCLGLTFKADVDDFRESPSLKVANLLKERFGPRVKFDDPFINKLYSDHHPLQTKMIEKTDDILVLLVDHNEYKKIEPRSKFIIDTRGCWSNV